MRSLKDTIEYLEDQLAELKLENDRLYKENQKFRYGYIEPDTKPFGYLIKTELQDGSVEESFIKAEDMKYKYIMYACDFWHPIPLYK